MIKRKLMRANQRRILARKGCRMKKKAISAIAAMMVVSAIFGGCGQARDGQRSGETEQGIVKAENGSANAETGRADDAQAENEVSELEVRFGDEGSPFTMYLEENDTAAAMARYVGSSDWRLPIYEREEDADYHVMQYYDIPNRYEIPSDPENITSAKAGEVYYSDPNRIVLFYRDAELSEEYTKIGHFDATEEFVTAVEENPVLEGWGNKIVHISRP